MHETLRFKLLPLIFLGGFSFQALAADTNRRTLNLSWDPWCPHTCADLARPGYMNEIVSAVFAGSLFDINSEAKPWAQALQETRSGSVDAVVGANRSDAADFLFPKFEIGKQQSCFYMFKGNKFTFSGLEKLPPGKKLGVVQDYAYGEPADSWIKKNEKRIIPVFGVDTFHRLSQLLLSTKVDLILEDRAVAHYAFLGEKLQSDAPQIEEIKCQAAIPLYLAFSPARGNEKAIRALRYFESEFPKFKNTHFYREILKKYGVEL